MIVHTSEVPPTAVTSDLYQTLENIPIFNHILSVTYSSNHNAEYHPAISPDIDQACGRVMWKLAQTQNWR